MATGKLSNPKLKDAQKATFGASAAVQTYVASILKQDTIKLEEMPDLPKHQEVARKNALKWNETVLPGMIQTNADIIDYANQFNAYYCTLVKLADDVAKDPTARAKFIEGLTLLRKDIVKKKQNTMSVITNLQVFNKELSADYTTFSADAAKATKLYEGKSGAIAKLSSQIDTVQSTMNKYIGVMAGGAVGIIGGVVLIFVGALATIETAGLTLGLIIAGVGLLATGITSEIVGGVQYGIEVGKLAELKEKLAADKQGLMGVKTVKGQLDGLVSQLTQALAALNILIREWSDLDSSMEKVLNDVQRDPGTYGPELKAILDRATQDWDEALSLALKMQPNGQLPTKDVAKFQDVIHTGA